MSAENLWGELPVGDEVKPPIAILREQATLLSDMTNKILVGEVRVKRTGKAGDELIFALEIIAPALDNYTYSVLTVRHGMFLYPATVMDLNKLVNGEYQKFKCNDETEYKETLKNILTSPQVHRAVSSLISQSKEPIQ